MGKYLKYAIGEIILVVIGILIAIQINNWNEDRKNDELVVSYLERIKSDLEKDLVLIEDIVSEQTKAIAIINNIDSVFINDIHSVDNYPSLLKVVDTLNFKQLFYRGLSFRSTGATYNSIVSDGKSGLIDNRILFEKIQKIYDVLHLRISSIYGTMRDRDEKINWAYSIEKKKWKYSDLVKAKDEKIFLDLSNFAETKYFYCQHLIDLKRESERVIAMIDQELN